MNQGSNQEPLRCERLATRPRKICVNTLQSFLLLSTPLWVFFLNLLQLPWTFFKVDEFLFNVDELFSDPMNFSSNPMNFFKFDELFLKLHERFVENDELFFKVSEHF